MYALYAAFSCILFGRWLFELTYNHIILFRCDRERTFMNKVWYEHLLWSAIASKLWDFSKQPFLLNKKKIILWKCAYNQNKITQIIAVFLSENCKLFRLWLSRLKIQCHNTSTGWCILLHFDVRNNFGNMVIFRMTPKAQTIL